MELEIMLTGIGGQGVQLGAQILARATALEGREVMYLGTYGGTMRGGNTDSTIVVADTAITTPPMVSRIGAALAMHHEFWSGIEGKLRPGASVVLNSTVFEGEVRAEGVDIYLVPATQIATELGSPVSASMVLIGAYASLSGIVKLESLVEEMTRSLPAYRRQHVQLNEHALQAGYEALESNLAAAAWTRTGGKL